jgi:uncharacterized protein (DUF58 family)
MRLRLAYRTFRLLTGSWYRTRRRFTVPGLYVLGFTAIAASFGLDTNLTVAYQAFSLLFLLLAFSAVWSFFDYRFSGSRISSLLAILFPSRRRGSSGFAAERILPKFGTVGVPLKYTVCIRNQSSWSFKQIGLLENFADPRPSWEEFKNFPKEKEKRQAFGDKILGSYRWSQLLKKRQITSLSEQPLPPLAPRSETTTSVELIPMRRGKIRFQALTLAGVDLLGLLRTFHHLKLEQSVMVLPKRYSIPPFELPGNQQYQQGGVSMASSVGESEEFVSLRDYQPGDPLRKIHWRSWAKTGHPVVREYQDEYFVRYALILDTFAGEEAEERFEEAVSVAASLVCTIDNQDSLIDLMFVGAKAFQFTAGRGLGSPEKLLEVLASVELHPEQQFESLQRLLLAHLPSVTSCFCIFLEWNEDRKKLVQLLQNYGIPLRVFIVSEKDAPSIEGSTPGVTLHQLRVGEVAQNLQNIPSA